MQMTLMTSWAVVCDVYFLEPQSQQEGESSQQFAERVQHLIATKANLKVAPWDGYLKYYNLGKKVSTVIAHPPCLERPDCASCWDPCCEEHACMVGVVVRRNQRGLQMQER